MLTYLSNRSSILMSGVNIFQVYLTSLLNIIDYFLYKALKFVESRGSIKLDINSNNDLNFLFKPFTFGPNFI